MFSEFSKVMELTCYSTYTFIQSSLEARVSYAPTDLEPTTQNVCTCFQLLCLLHICQFQEKWPLENGPISLVFHCPLNDVTFHTLAFSHALPLSQLCLPSMIQEISILSIKHPWLTKSVIASPQTYIKTKSSNSYNLVHNAL